MRTVASVPETQTDLMSLLPYAVAFAAGATGDVAEVTALETKLRTWAKEDPLDAVLATILGGGIAYYLAEKDTNPDCNNPWDGILYMVTTMSMGATTDVKPTTQAGQALTAFVQTFGPTLALSAFEAPAAEKRAAAAQEAAVQVAILERLERIVQLLEQR